MATHLTHLSHHPTYTISALRKYFLHINLPTKHQATILKNLPPSPHQHHPGQALKALQKDQSHFSPRHQFTDWGTTTEALRVLEVLQRYQQAKIPFSNLYLHYSPHHTGTLDPEGIYRYLINSETITTSNTSSSSSSSSSSSLSYSSEPILNPSPSFPQGLDPATNPRDNTKNPSHAKWQARPASGGRGGTCTLNNTFFSTVLRTLGMRVMTTGARVSCTFGSSPSADCSTGGSEEGMFKGWNHLLNLVWVEGRWWLVDVGFGDFGPTSPLPLLHNQPQLWGNTTSLLRLIHNPLAQFTDPDSKAWILQYLPHPPAPYSLSSQNPTNRWRDIYAFTTTEFLPADIQVMNYSTTSNIRSSFFYHLVMCTRTIVEGDEIIGSLSLVGDKLKKRIRGQEVREDSIGEEEKAEVIAVCRSERERWEVLEKWFGIILNKEEREGIRGLATELRGDWEE